MTTNLIRNGNLLNQDDTLIWGIHQLAISPS